MDAGKQSQSIKGGEVISKTVKYNTKSQMELGISLMIADGWKLETTDFIPEKRCAP